MSCTEYKGLPQGSVLSPFLYSLLGSGVDRFNPARCGIPQYVDDVVVYASHRIMENGMLGSQGFFFDMVGLTVKSEVMVFSRKHHKPDVTLWIDTH
jgi:hypothetical protein